jgi:hypothetical protein
MITLLKRNPANPHMDAKASLKKHSENLQRAIMIQTGK